MKEENLSLYINNFSGHFNKTLALWFNLSVDMMI